MKKMLLAIYDSFSEFEITVATAMLRGTYEIVTVADSLKTITGESGLQFVPHLMYQQVNATEYEGIIIPGGDLINVKDTEELFELTNIFYKQNKLTAAICSGTYALARAGVLGDKPYTVTLNQKQRNFLGCFVEENFRYEPVVKAGNVITAQGHAYVDFGLAVAEQLGALTHPDFTKEFYKGERNQLMEEAVK
ncbi:glutamine amidotransferase [Bacillus timonensis]|uniref:Glutamine amidotransferase n=1 Tax=Bacillus timonensis TaxID=1033734 RepID=A0A4S3PTP0_9BACI|nr:DJ-1/PfpI family protein [Bacillus timonensis]THE12988.1 glutamine amidotransferase [Bacillus timonensis]